MGKFVLDEDDYNAIANRIQPEEKILGSKEVRALLGSGDRLLSSQMLKKFREQKVNPLPYHTKGNIFFYLRSEVLEWIKS